MTFQPGKIDSAFPGCESMARVEKVAIMSKRKLSGATKNPARGTPTRRRAPAQPPAEDFDPRAWMINNHPMTASWLGYDLVTESLEQPKRRTAPAQPKDA
jgi:hypothetical protein